jgi:hypothetical protein
MFPNNIIFYCRINGRIVFHLEAIEIQRLIANSGTTLYLDIGTYTVKKDSGNNLIIPGQGEFGKRHPGWGRENR